MFLCQSFFGQRQPLPDVFQIVISIAKTDDKLRQFNQVFHLEG